LGQPTAAVVRYEQALRAFEKSTDLVFKAHTLVRLGELARVQGDYPRARKYVTQALEHAPLEAHVVRANALIALAKSTGFLKGMDEGHILAERALQEARLAGDEVSPLARANLLRSLGQICWWHGDPQSTVRYCQEALQIVPDALSPTAARACISIATPHLYWRHLDTALDYAERGLEIAQQLQFNELLPSAYTALGNVLTRRGEVARAESALRQALDLAHRQNLAAYERVMATGFLAYNLYGQGRIDEAWQLAEGALWSYSGNPDTYEVYVCRSVLADIALERDQFDVAERLFLDLVEVGERRQFRIPLAMVYFGLAYIYLTTQRVEQGVEHATRSLNLLESTNALQLYLDQGERAQVVCQALAAVGVRSLFLSRALADLPGKAGGSVHVIHRHSAVTIKCLGDFRVFVNGEEVRQERWVSAKARDLLAYFITFRQERLPADRLNEALWPQKGYQTKRALPTALYRLRQALRAEGQSTKYVVVEAGEYWLDTARFQLDIDEFDTTLAQARAAENLSPMEAAAWYERAITLYEGDFLANYYYDWVFPERRHLQQTLLTALNRLGDLRAAGGNHDQALAAFQRSLRIDNLQEQIYCEIMRSYAALGDRTGISRQYQSLTVCLDEELGLAPQPGSKELYNALMSGSSR
ncbi:MAG: tetratricopeptide repeat protein, partial [Chloroflexi bacterium]|nr:tetratricopeptide repeat protein [Chloroflexota bacterium]